MRYNRIILLITIIFISSIYSFGNNQIVKTGIEVLKDNNFDILQGKRVGLITNPTGVDSELRSTIDILFEAKNVNLVALFGPEHGVRGDVYAGDKVQSSTDTKTGLPIYSIYGKNRKPTKEMLSNIDVLVYDIQDIGCRSYTFISTMGLAMIASAESDIEFIVLDRPNPLGGEKIEGNLVEDQFISFVSQIKIPYLYAQTPGELALMLNEENMLGIKCKLKVVKMQGWKRDMIWADTKLQWVPASPHIPNSQTAIYYPTTGILGELGYLNIGVGYPLPFQTIGAPWINGDSLADILNSKKLPGVLFRPIYYKPFYSTYQGELCGGIEIHITDYEKCRLTEIQFIVMEVLNDMYPEKATFKNANTKRFSMFDKVCGTDEIRIKFSKNHKWSDIKDYFSKDEQTYFNISKKYYLYEK